MADNETAPAPAAPVAAPKADSGEEILNLKSDARDERSSNRNSNRDDRDRRDRPRGGRGGGRGRGGSRGGFKKRNTEFEDLPETDDHGEILKQVEFYFSTQNLVTDEHLFNQLCGPENRPVPIKHIANFKRMRRFQPYSAIVAALRESKDLVVVDDGEFAGTGNEAVKRAQPLVCPARDGDDTTSPSLVELFMRLKAASSNRLETSMYAKNFGSEAEAGQIALEQFFAPYGSVMVRKRREDDGTWKGSVFVEFESEASQQQFLALDPKPTFNGNVLEALSKKDYILKKCAEKGIKPDWELTEEERQQQRQQQRRDNNDRNGGGRGRGGRGGRGGFGGRGGGRGRDNRDRRDGRDRRDRRDRDGSADADDWNNRRDRFQNGKDDSAADAKPKEIQRDAHGVPIVQDTSNKRKADDAEREDGAKKGKLEIKEDE